MYHFQYVSKNEIASLKNQVIELIGLVQDEIRNYFTFQYKFIGSVKLNMVTCDVKSNIGFDFDVNIMVNDDDEEYSAKDIKQILMKAFNKYAYKYHYDFAKTVHVCLLLKSKTEKILEYCIVVILQS